MPLVTKTQITEALRDAGVESSDMAITILLEWIKELTDEIEYPDPYANPSQVVIDVAYNIRHMVNVINALRSGVQTWEQMVDHLERRPQQ